MVFFAIFVIFVIFANSEMAHARSSTAPTTQLSIDIVDLMPNRPEPFKLKDYKAIALGCDKLLFDFDQKGQYLPLVWWDDTRVNVDMRGVCAIR